MSSSAYGIGDAAALGSIACLVASGKRHWRVRWDRVLPVLASVAVMAFLLWLAAWAIWGLV